MTDEAQAATSGNRLPDVVASEIRTMDDLARRTRYMEKAPVPLLQKVLAIACATTGCP